MSRHFATSTPAASKSPLCRRGIPCAHGGLANHRGNGTRLKCTGNPRDPSPNPGLRRAKYRSSPKMAKNV
eukprot:1158304-Pelagomonas_calceolata.AAC.1